MRIGVAYYPEQWPEEQWPVDAQLMQELGIDVVRVGEFAWSSLEPKRERIDMDWLDRAVRVLAEHGLKVIMCTPTAAPPNWLFNRHPSILPQDADGRRWYAGSRRHVCLNNAAYQKYVRRIVAELAKRFAANPNVYAWQIDNEFGCHDSAVCYCDDCEQAFRHWLKRRYGTIERLNTLWGTAFWSQYFGDWHEIPAPRRTPAGAHPSLALDYKRFVSATCRSFIIEQSGIIRDYGGENVPIMTNSPGPCGVTHLNHFSLAEVQDVAALDSYPSAESRLDAVACSLDFMRSVKRKPFWILEQQAGATVVEGWACQPRPGQLRLWSYQAAARGAELITYFRWRTAAFGQEMHWYGMLDADAAQGRRFEELRRTIAEIKQHSHLWQGCLPEADVAIVVDYDSAWALDVTRMGVELDWFGQAWMLYRLLRRMGAQVDLVRPEEDLSSYRVAVVPMPFICDAPAAEWLTGWVSDGRSLLVTAPAGYKTWENTTISGAPPGALTELLGVRVVEHDVLIPGMDNTVSLWEGESFPVGPFCSVLELCGADAVGTYGAQYYAGSPAVTCRTVGEGRAFFVGALCGPECCEAVLRRVVEGAGVRLCEWSSESVETVRLREPADGPQLTFVLNHSQQPVTLPLPAGASCRDMLSGQECQGTVTLEGYQVALLSL